MTDMGWHNVIVHTIIEAIIVMLTMTYNNEIDDKQTH